jgi:hypothetical protein
MQHPQPGRRIISDRFLQKERKNMRKTSVCIFTLLLLVALTGLPVAGQTGTTTTTVATPSGTSTTTTTTAHPKHHGPKHPKCKSAKGALADKAADCATFKVGDRSFSANDKTTWWDGKKKATCADFANGDNVSVTCTTKDGVDWAKSVRKSKPKMMKTTTTTTTTTATPPPHR